jgi:opacity protein-like surface antigen
MRLTILAGSLLLAVGTTAAQSADIYAPSRGGMKDLAAGEETYIPPADTFQETADWFIRGDVGFTHFSGYEVSGVSDGGNPTMAGFNLDQPFSGSLGFGRYVTPQVRLGIDVDYRHNVKDTFSNDGLTTTSPIYNIGALPLEFNTTSVMLGAVYDFAPEYHVSPYIGGAVGWSFHELKIKGHSYSNDFDADGNPDAGTIGAVDASSDSFTAALMAGLSFRLRQDLFMDVGYKFSYLGDVKTNYDYTITASGGGSAGGGGAFSINDLMAHDVRVGLRYDLY